MKANALLLTLLMVGNIAFGQLNPSKEYSMTPADFGMNYEEKEIQGPDDVKLKAWFFKPSETSKKIIIISDDGKGNMADNIELVSQFLSLGFHVLTYDYRGFGGSSDFEINKKFYIRSEFQKDLEAVINWSKKYQAKLTAVDLYGIGMGGGLSIAVGANNSNVRYVVADSPYWGLEHMKKKIKEVQGQDVLMPLGYNKNEMEPKYALVEEGGHLDGVLIIAGESDLIIGPDDVKMMSKESKVKLTTYLAEGAVAEETFSSNKDNYFEAIKKFMKL